MRCTLRITVALSLALAGCGGRDSRSAVRPVTTSEAAPTIGTGAVSSGAVTSPVPSGAVTSTPPGAQEFSRLVIAQDRAFQPASIEGRPGGTLAVTIVNRDDVAHTFLIDELSVDQEVPPGEQRTVHLTPRTTGAYRFFCEIHRAQNMAGTLNVSS